MKCSTTKQNSNTVNDKLLDLNLIDNIKKSNLHIEYLNTKIKFYENQIQMLKENKPPVFQKKELQDYYKKKEQYKQKIKQLYNEINEEFISIAKLYENLKY